MSSISAVKKLIDELEKEDELQRRLHEERLAEQKKKYEEITEMVTHYKEQNEKHLENITKGLTQLVANKYTIKKALGQADNDQFNGLPIPHEEHSTVIDLFSKMSGFLNNPEILNKRNVVTPQEIHQDIVCTAESIANDLKDCSLAFDQAEALYRNTNELKVIINSDDI